MRSLVSFATHHPAAYITTCSAFGLLIRYWMAAGDLGKFINPFFPLFTH